MLGSSVGGRDPPTKDASSRSSLFFLFYNPRGALEGILCPSSRSFVRSFGCVGLLSLQGKKREREANGGGKTSVCVYFRTIGNFTHTHVEEPTRKRKKNHKKMNTESLFVL